MISLADIEDILYDGTEDQMKSLPKGVSYSFNPKYKSMHISFGTTHQKGYGSDTPKCVKHFGREHTF